MWKDCVMKDWDKKVNLKDNERPIESSEGCQGLLDQYENEVYSILLLN